MAGAEAAERNPEITRAFVEDGHEIVSHGYRLRRYLSNAVPPGLESPAGLY